MKINRIFIAVITLALIIGKSMLALADDSTPTSAIERGKHFVLVYACSDCHSPKIFTDKGPVADQEKFLSGYPEGEKLPPLPTDILGPGKWGAVTTNDLTAWVGPWGVSFTANLTPDPTGLGNWTEEMFMKAMRTGKHLGAGRDILPPMPWYGLKELSDADLKAVFAYLKTLKPVKNNVPAPIPPSGPPGGKK